MMRWASGSIHVVTNVARLRFGIPSRSSSSPSSRIASAAAMPVSGSRRSGASSSRNALPYRLPCVSTGVMVISVCSWSCRDRGVRRERLLADLAAGADGDGGGLGDLVPRAGQVGERLGDDQAVLVAQTLDPGVLRVQRPQRLRVGRDEEAARAPLRRVAERPQGGSVTDADAALERELDPVPAPGLLDAPDGLLD